MSQKLSVRQMYQNGKSLAEIQKETKLCYRSIRKCLEQEDFSESMETMRTRERKLTPYKDELELILIENKNNWYKQRLTGRRLYSLFTKKHPDIKISYDTILRFYSDWNETQRKEKEQGFSHLTWHPGEAQADFGEADFYVNNKLQRLKYFVLSFPHANKAYVQIYRGENCECVCQALINIFEYLKGVPPIIVFDNATGIGRRVCKILEENEMFLRFKAQYHFISRFCNPYSGHEKGNVEANVAYIRKNLFVPFIHLPENIEEYNKTELFIITEQLMNSRMHYIHNISVNTLFEEDKKSFLPLPSVRFQAKRILSVTTNKWSEFTLDSTHRYTLSSNYCSQKVIIETWPWEIYVYDTKCNLIEKFERRYGSDNSTSISLINSITNVTKRPGSWSNSTFRESLATDNSFRSYMDNVSEVQKKKQIFQQVLKAMESFDEDVVLSSISEMAQKNIDMTKECNYSSICSRISSGTFGNSSNVTGVDLTVFDSLLKTNKEICHEN